MSLVSLLQSGAKIQDVAAHLDSLGHAARLGQMRELSGAEQKRLYELAAEAPPLDLEHFVPAAAPELAEVVHFGRNSQPAFRNFEKRFCRPPGDPERLFGYNEGVLRPVIGPGYFVARRTRAGEGPDPRGAVVVDYFLVPDAAVAPGWPVVRANDQGLQRFVYHQTRDYMRRVSRHCSIGIAWRKEHRVLGYFVLCRGD